MNHLYSNVTCGGMDVHHKFSNVTFRDEAGCVVRRERLEHPQRGQLWERLNRWPKGLPMVLEASFGWGWLRLSSEHRTTTIATIRFLGEKIRNC